MVTIGPFHPRLILVIKGTEYLNVKNLWVDDVAKVTMMVSRIQAGAARLNRIQNLLKISSP